jgi:hypothetical protein
LRTCLGHVVDPDPDSCTPLESGNGRSCPLRGRRALGLAAANMVAAALVAFVVIGGGESNRSGPSGPAGVMAVSCRASMTSRSNSSATEDALWS